MKLAPILRLLALTLILLQSSAIQASQPLSFAVVPQVPPDRIMRTWTPVLNEVTRLTGIEFRLTTYASIPEFEATFLSGHPDLAYLNPYHMVMARKAAGYIPIIRDDKRRLTGILVVRADSPITRLDQLNGATLAFPAPNAFGASLYLRALLSEDARIRFTARYVNTHSNVYRQVIAAQATAGGGVRQTLERESQEMQGRLRVLYETPPVFPHPIAIHPRVPVGIRTRLQEAFLEMGKQHDVLALLSAISITVPVRAGYEDYSPLESLGLERHAILNAN